VILFYAALAVLTSAPNKIVCEFLFGRPCVVTEGLMFLLCFSSFFFIFHFSSKTGQQTKTKNGEKDDPYLEGIEFKYRRNLSRGLGGKGILIHFISTV